MKNEKKWNVGWGPITSCNMNCQFCYSKHVRKESNELEKKDWIKFIDLNHMYINNINYGTGENSISDDWFDLVEYIASNYNLQQAVTTNGYISERVLHDDRLYQIFTSAISEIDISLDFADEKMHNYLRGQDKAYEWAMKTLELCQKCKISTTIVFLGTESVLQPKNLDGLFKIAKQYDAKLRMNIFRPTRGIDEVSKQFIPSYKCVVTALKYINDNYKILAICDPLFNSILNTGHFCVDPSGSCSIRILGDGSITPSTYLISDKFVMGNIKEGKILNKLEIDNIDFNIPGQCKNCLYAEQCNGGVYDRRYLWYGDFDSSDPYCPFREENYVPDFKVDIADDISFSSIHDGYLPTVFFSN